MWVHPPFHSALEGCGAVVALLLAWLVGNLERRGEGTSFNPQIIAALIGLGVLDGLHAATHPGDAFVWLRGSSTFVCGAMAALMWLPRSWFDGIVGVPFGVLIAALALTMGSLVGWQGLPPMLEDGRLTPAAQALNLAGGALLWFAALRLFLTWRQKRRADDLSFCILGALTGSAAITLSQAALWDATWWASHALRFGANAGGLWFVAFTDTRLQAKAEAASRALADLNASLEQRVAQRTAELEVARDAANAASRAKSEFLANMSHEIRTPLNAVIGLTEVVLRTELDPFQRDHLHTVMDSGSSLVQVINDILDFSKIEAGKVDLERASFGLEDVICEALKPLAVRAQGKGLELACLVRPEVPRVVIGDPGRIRQVLTNLVGNAISYTERGQVLVRVGVEQNASKVQISVLDSGVGIPPDKLSRIFESFEQVDSSTTRKYGGTGLGLAISRRLVEMMGGEISVASEPGVGSVFSFTVDCEVAPENARRAAARAALTERLSGERVLIVDESQTERTILAAMARSAEMLPVTSAHASEEAFALLRRAAEEGEPIRRVVVSADDPAQDSFRLIERVRGCEELADVVLVLVTSASPHPLLLDAVRLGVASRLMKPVVESELLEVLASAPGRAGAERWAARSPGEDGAALAQPSGRRLRVLLVEDSPANQKLALAILGAEGHAVTVAGDGRIALAQLAEQPFDVVLMDIQMPEMDGFQTTAAIRSGHAGCDPEVPIVAMTAHALRGDREKCLEIGMDDYIAKPIRRDDLLEILQRVTA